MTIQSSAVAIVTTSEEPWWLSAQFIKNGIISTYQQQNPQIQIIKYSEKRQDLKEVCQQIAQRKIKKLIFVESNPQPISFIEQLLSQPTSVEEFCFHVYGNVSYHTPDWLKTFKALKGKGVKVIVASKAQQGQLKAIMGSSNQACIEVCPFPIQKTPTLIDREGHRKRWGLGPQDFVLVYTGRLSLMKNLNLLIEFVDEFLQKHPKYRSSLKLVLAGDFDDVGANFLHLNLNEYFYLWNQWFDTLSPELKKIIRNIGFQDQEDITSLVYASDLYVSLSTFHDEDFGMAPLEALTQGTPALLSAWGGYRDFGFDKKSVSLIPVKNTTQGLKIDYLTFEKEMLKRLLKAQSHDRAHTRINYLNKYSPEKVGLIYRKIHIKRFPKLKTTPSLLSRHAQIIEKWRQGKGVVYPTLSKSDTLYTKIYGPYWGN